MYLHVTFSREREKERERERERAPHHYYEKSVKLFKLSFSVPSFLSLSFSYRFFFVHTKADENLLLL
jgi:hypothetical protein